jgi:outer membrane protein OmpA-like peptidoglycan-associated protein
VTKDDRGTIITLSGAVIFASGHSELLPAAKSKLDQVATALNVSESASKIIVQGYTDSRGSAALNQDLSTRRAESVKDYLVSKGVAGERLSSEGLGPSNPVADNETAEGRANNRRVEIIVQPVGDASRHRTSSN